MYYMFVSFTTIKLEKFKRQTRANKMFALKHDGLSLIPQNPLLGDVL